MLLFEMFMTIFERLSPMSKIFGHGFQDDVLVTLTTGIARRTVRRRRDERSSMRDGISSESSAQTNDVDVDEIYMLAPILLL
jgi:hypothetical protein